MTPDDYDDALARAGDIRSRINTLPASYDERKAGWAARFDELPSASAIRAWYAAGILSPWVMLGDNRLRDAVLAAQALNADGVAMLEEAAQAGEAPASIIPKPERLVAPTNDEIKKDIVIGGLVAVGTIAAAVAVKAAWKRWRENS